MGEEDSVKNQDQEGNRSLWEVLQSPVRNNIRARILLISQVQAVSLYFVCCVGVLSVIGQN